MKMKFAAALVLIGMLALGLAACGTGAGGGGAMLDLVPAGNYEAMVSIKPAELFNSEFLTNLKESFPLIQMLIASAKSQMGDTAVDIEELDMVLFAGSTEEQLVLFKAGWSEEDLVAEYEKDNAVELVKTDYAGMSYWLDETESKAMAHIGDVFVTGTEDMVKKAIDLQGGTGEKYADSEAFAKAKKYINLDATLSFYSDDVKKGMDLEGMKMQLAAEGDDEATIEAVAAAMENLTAVGGSIKVTNAIAGDVAMLFSDDASAKAMLDFAGPKKDKAFQEAADSLENMGAMMSINADKDKFMKLAEKISFSQGGTDMITKVNIAWADLAFLFETPAE